MVARPPSADLRTFLRFFQHVAQHDYSEGSDTLSACISSIQKQAKTGIPILEDSIKAIAQKTLKKDYVECEKAYFSLAQIKEKDTEKGLLAKLTELAKDITQHKLAFDKRCVSMTEDDRIFSGLLKELTNVLEAKKILAQLYLTVAANGDLTQNRKHYINSLDEIIGPLSVSVNAPELKATKVAIELEINSLKAVLECLECVSQFDHILSVTQLAKLHTTIKEYKAKFVTRPKSHSKNNVWKWIAYCYFALEAKIALFFNPYFVDQKEAIESYTEELKTPPTSTRDKKLDQALPPTKLDLFKPINKLVSDHECSVFLLLDKNLLMSPSPLLFSSAFEFKWRFASRTSMLYLVECHKEKVSFDRPTLNNVMDFIAGYSAKLKVLADIEVYEDLTKDRWKFFVAAIDKAVLLCVIATERYGEKKYAERIKRDIKSLCADCRSDRIVEQLNAQETQWFP